MNKKVVIVMNKESNKQGLIRIGITPQKDNHTQTLINKGK
jgi:hypothetical protein